MIASCYYFDREPCHSFQELVECLPDSEFLNLTRSTIPLLVYWRRRSRVGDLLEFVGGLSLPSSAALHFEYQVPSVGRARASHTDLMVLAGHFAVGIEGKSTEPQYETVGEWLSKGGRARPAVLNHWLGLIERVTGQSPRGSVEDLTYQMVHRLASACSIDATNRMMMYQIFDRGGELPDYATELARIARVLGTGDHVELLLDRIPTSVADGYRQVDLQLASTTPEERAGLIRKAVIHTRLFDFGTPETSTISS